MPQFPSCCIQRFPITIGELSPHPQILREASALCNQLPVLEKNLFSKDFHSVINKVLSVRHLSYFSPQQTNEVLLVSYLAAITKGTATASEVSFQLGCPISHFLTSAAFYLYSLFLRWTLCLIAMELAGGQGEQSCFSIKKKRKNSHTKKKLNVKSFQLIT